MNRPLLEQRGGRIVTSEIGGESLFEGPAKQHSGAGVLLFPGVEIAIPVAARAREVLANLRVAVGHQATSGLPLARVDAEDNVSHWLAGAKPSSLSREVPCR